MGMSKLWIATGYLTLAACGVQTDGDLATEPELQQQAGAAVGALVYRCDPAPPEPEFPPGSGQIGNPAYCPELQDPLFGLARGPRILFDQGHNNFGTIAPTADSPAAGRSFATAELLRADGFVVDALDGPISAAALESADILVLSHALPAPYQVFDPERGTEGMWVHNPAAFEERSAYSDAEIVAVATWVRGGGSLLINSEHTPFTGAMSSLAQAFGFTLNDNAGGVFSSSFDKSTRLHPIFRGRNASESIAVVPNVAGGSRVHFSSGTPLFQAPLLSVAMDITARGFEASFQYGECVADPPDDVDFGCELYRRIQAEESSWYCPLGDVVAATRTFGRGRVAIFTEFATFTSQLTGSTSSGVAAIYGGLRDERSQQLYGLPSKNEPDTTQLVLNAFHWLAFRL